MSKHRKHKTSGSQLNNEATERQENRSKSSNVTNYVSGDPEWSSSSHQFSREPNSK